MAVRRTESRKPSGFEFDELGQAFISGDYALVSYLTSPITVKSNQSYVIFAISGAPADSYRWKFVLDTAVDAVENETEEGFITYRPDKTGELFVYVDVVSSGDIVAELFLSQLVQDSDKTIEDLIKGIGVRDNLNAELGAIVGEPQTTREVINDLQKYIIDASYKTGNNGIDWRFLAAIVYKEALHRPKEISMYRHYIVDLNILTMGEAVRETELALAAEELNNPSSLFNLRSQMDNSLGVCQIQPQTAAMVLGITEWLQKPKGKKEREEINKQVLLNFNNLTDADNVKIDIYNLLRFPKSNISLGAKYLEKLKNRVDPYRYGLLSRNEFQTDNSAMGIIATEYNMGPTTTTVGEARASEYGGKILKFIGSPFLNLMSVTGEQDLLALLTYHGISMGQFLAYEDKYFAQLSFLLRQHNIIGSTETIDRRNFYEAVCQFQTEKNMGADGIPGQDTLWQLQYDWTVTRKMNKRKEGADVWIRPPRTIADWNEDEDGSDYVELREDAALRYAAMRLEMVTQGAIITCAGGLRPLEDVHKPDSSKSETSLHYSGLALDLATTTGMLSPDLDPFVITKDNSYWRVWARTELGAERRLDAVVWNDGAISIRSVTARFLDFTALAESYGFRRIHPRKEFPKNRMHAEWWHFQCEDLLVPWISQFGAELLAVYSEARLQGEQAIWKNRKKVFMRKNNGWS